MCIRDRLNTEDINIITVEDPVEANLDGVNQVQVNAKADMTFASALRSILRQDPDIIMIGEIRDEETAEIAVQASITGHLVVSTLHTNSAAGTITRMLNICLLYTSSLFAEEEEQREVAELFHARIHEVDSAAERDKALKETILRVKDNSISYRSAHLEPTDMQGLQQLVADKRTLQNMEKMHISID